MFRTPRNCLICNDSSYCPAKVQTATHNYFFNLSIIFLVNRQIIWSKKNLYTKKTASYLILEAGIWIWGTVVLEKLGFFVLSWKNKQTHSVWFSVGDVTLVVSVIDRWQYMEHSCTRAPSAETPSTSWIWLWLESRCFLWEWSEWTFLYCHIRCRMSLILFFVQNCK